MKIENVSRKKYTYTMFYAVLGSCLIVAILATLGRAAFNFTAALTHKPDIAIYMLLPEETIGKTTLLREKTNERHYLTETREGPKLVILKKGEKSWYVSDIEPLR